MRSVSTAKPRQPSCLTGHVCFTPEVMTNVRLTQVLRIYLLSLLFPSSSYPTEPYLIPFIIPLSPKRNYPIPFTGRPQRRPAARRRPPAQEASRTARTLAACLLNSAHVSGRVAGHTFPSHLKKTPCTRGNTCDKDCSPGSGARSGSFGVRPRPSGSTCLSV